MARPAMTSSAFSRQVVRAVEQFRDERGLTNTELIRASGLSANYFYIRLRGEAPYNTNDLERLADALNVDPHELLQLAESPALATDDPDRTERVDGEELRRRLTVLTAGAAGQAAKPFDLNELVAFLHERGVAFAVENWSALLSHVGAVRLPVRLLGTLAEYFSVDDRYLRATRDQDIAVLVEGRLSLQQALVEVGAVSLSKQDLNEFTVEQLDAVIHAIRSIPTQGADAS